LDLQVSPVDLQTHLFALHFSLQQSDAFRHALPSGMQAHVPPEHLSQQHWSSDLQVSPTGLQTHWLALHFSVQQSVAFWHRLPFVMQAHAPPEHKPVQQLELSEQEDPGAEHDRHLPPEQFLEQQSDEFVQSFPAARQVTHPCIASHKPVQQSEFEAQYSESCGHAGVLGGSQM
jgi:hypothetical protein